METIFKIGRRIIPKSIFNFFQPAYHFVLAFLGALIYKFPSRKMTIIGITGTKGKTTASNLIAYVLNSSGYKTGLSTTINFKIGDREWKNNFKQTMIGRFRLQKLLSQMAKEGCKYAVIETSSEGIMQFRHKFIDYDIAVFLNLSPEHLERHKGFENYKKEKIKLFRKIAQKRHGIGIYNLDEEFVFDFLQPKIYEKYGFSLNINEPTSAKASHKVNHIVSVEKIKLEANKSSFVVSGNEYQIPLIGEFNVANAAAAICVALSQKIPVEKIQQAFKNFKALSGRMEIINQGQDFSVIVDYAHEPKSLEAAYKAVAQTGLKQSGGKLICLLGSAGGGRDKWKRPQMGSIAAHYCDEIILTNEDPYDENPQTILADIKQGIVEKSFNNSKLHEIMDRKEAIKKALKLANKGDAVILTGKGGETWMCLENGKKIPWDEKEIVKELLQKI